MIAHARTLLAAVCLAVAATPAWAAVQRVPKDHATIQAAVDAASNGDKIVIKKGVYAENVLVSGKSNLLIRGSRMAVISPVAGNAINVANSPGTRIKGLTLRGPVASVAYLNSPGGLVSKCHLEGAGGVAMASSNGSRVVGCRIEVSVTGLAFAGTGKHHAERCTLVLPPDGEAIRAVGESVEVVRCRINYTGANTASAIRADVSVSALVDRCRITMDPPVPGAFGIETHTTAPAATGVVQRNRISGAWSGVVMTFDGSVCRGNRVVRVLDMAYLIGGDGSIVTRNRATGAPTLLPGIHVGFSTGVRVTRNVLSDFGDGVWLWKSNLCEVSGNTLKNMTNGVYVESTSNGNTIGPRNKYKKCNTRVEDQGTNTTVLD